MSKAKNTLAITTKEANKKIENNEKLTQKEVEQLQRSQRDISSDCYKSLEKVATKNFKVVSIDDTMRINTDLFKSVEVCNKKTFTTLYISTKMKSVSEMKRLHDLYKTNHKSVFDTVDTTQFLDSKDFQEKHRLQLKTQSVVSDKMKKDIIEALKELANAQETIIKARKQA